MILDVTLAWTTIAGRRLKFFDGELMKFLGSHLSYMLEKHQSRKNLKAFVKYLAFLTIVITGFSFLFHVIMLGEGREYSWVTGLYWTLTVMSTLGFGDITFTSDLGRLFSIVVLMSGILLLMIMLPFAFIRFFYAPWLDAHIRTQAPRRIPAETTGHVLLTAWETIQRDLAERLQVLGIPYFVVEPDPVRANELNTEGVPVITGDLDSTRTWRHAGIDNARAVFASLTDEANTNIILTVRELSLTVPIFSLAEKSESVDLLELAGATSVIALKQRLGEQLANRVESTTSSVHVVGKFRNLLIGEFPVFGTELAGKTLGEIHLRQKTGASVVGMWERGQFQRVGRDTVVGQWSIPVVVCTSQQLQAINELIRTDSRNNNPVLVIGGGKIGRATAAQLRTNGLRVNLVERDPVEADRARPFCDNVFVGDAADRDILQEAGVGSAPSVVITTNDDSTNAYLCIYFRKLNPQIRIVSRITHDRNIESIHRAGADFALSYASLGQESIMALLQGRESIFLGADVDFHLLDVPDALAGRTLRETNIGARTGLNVIAMQQGDTMEITGPDTRLVAGAKMIAIGTAHQIGEMKRVFNQPT